MVNKDRVPPRTIEEKDWSQIDWWKKPGDRGLTNEDWSKNQRIPEYRRVLRSLSREVWHCARPMLAEEAQLRDRLEEENPDNQVRKNSMCTCTNIRSWWPTKSRNGSRTAPDLCQTVWKAGKKGTCTVCCRNLLQKFTAEMAKLICRRWNPTINPWTLRRRNSGKSLQK